MILLCRELELMGIEESNRLESDLEVIFKMLLGLINRNKQLIG